MNRGCEYTKVEEGKIIERHTAGGILKNSVLLSGGSIMSEELFIKYYRDEKGNEFKVTENV